MSLRDPGAILAHGKFGLAVVVAQLPAIAVGSRRYRTQRLDSFQQTDILAPIAITHRQRKACTGGVDHDVLLVGGVQREDGRDQNEYTQAGGSAQADRPETVGCVAAKNQCWRPRAERNSASE